VLRRKSLLQLLDGQMLERLPRRKVERLVRTGEEVDTPSLLIGALFDVLL